MAKRKPVGAKNLHTVKIKRGVLSPRASLRLFQVYIGVVAVLGAWVFLSQGSPLVGLIFFLVTGVGGFLTQGFLARWIATRGGRRW